MTDDLTREHERALLACAFLGGAHVGSHTKSLESSQHLALICAKHGACRPRSTHTPGLLRPAVDFARAPEPAPALWRDPSSYVAHDPGALRRGVVDRRSSPPIGRRRSRQEHRHPGKSPAPPRPFGAACGLRAAPGPVAVVTYEDAPTRISARPALGLLTLKQIGTPAMARPGSALVR